MMTSPSTIRTPVLERSVRDVVAHQPELVNEIWCRKIFRHILQALERHHARRQPHAPLTPDTIGFDPSGEPVLLASTDSGLAPDEAADVQALGAVVHFAITREPVPVATLGSRSHAGFSESLVNAVDKCVARDPAERPQTIEQLRDLLGIVALGPAVPVARPVPLFTDAPMAPARAGIGVLGKWQRWALIGVAGVVLLGAASALWMLLRGTDTRDNIVLTLPQNVASAHTPDPNQPLLAGNNGPAQANPSIPAAGAAAGHLPGTAQAPAFAAPRPASNHVLAQAPARAGSAGAAPAARDEAERDEADHDEAAPARPTGTATRNAAEPAQTAYRLLIKPWGTVYVDGVERGVSPPLKHLSLSPGKHTVRVVNPNFRDRVLRVEAGKHGAAHINVDFTAPSR
jgi:hypothetical protein